MIVLLFILNPSKEAYEGFNFIDNFSLAEKKGFDENIDPSECLKDEIPAVTLKKLRDFNTLLFSGNAKVLSRDGKDVDRFNGKVTGGGFRFILKSPGSSQSRYQVLIKKVSERDYWMVDLLLGNENSLEIVAVRDGKTAPIERLKLPEKKNPITRLNILFFYDFLSIFSDDTLIFQCKHPDLNIPGYVKFKHEEIIGKSAYTVRFNVPVAKLMKYIDDRVISGVRKKMYKWDNSKPVWNLLGNEDNLVNSKSNYTRRLKLGNITMPAIYFLPGDSVTYKVTIPDESILSFYMALSPHKDATEKNGRFILEISEGKGQGKETFIYNIEDFLNNGTTFRRCNPSIKKFYGKECEIVFRYDLDYKKQSIFQDVPVFAIGSPNIFIPRKSDELNILLISLDTLRPDHLGVYGYDRNTSPNIDRFARESVLFRSATAQSNWTLTSHMSLFTGLFPFETGYFRGRDIHYSVRFSDRVRLLPEILRENGYKTGAITAGGYVSEYFGFDRGIDYYQLVEKDCSNGVSEAIDWLEKSRDNRFFLFFHTYEIHKPYIHDYFLNENKPGFSTLREETIARYDSGILYTDKQIGKLLDWLKDNNLYNNTIIIITSDHGENFDLVDKEKIPGVHGYTLYDREVQVPLIIGGAIGKNGGRTIKNQVSLVDLMPTILDYANIPATANIRGRSLGRIIEEDFTDSRIAYSEAVFHADEQKSIRNIEYKLIKTYKTRKRKHQTSMQLFNISNDKNESRNIIEQDISIKKMFISRLEEIIKDINLRYKTLKIDKDKTTERNRNLEKQLKALGYLGN